MSSVILAEMMAFGNLEMGAGIRPLTRGLPREKARSPPRALPAWWTALGARALGLSLAHAPRPRQGYERTK
jgi:hypothetical protein